MFQCHLNFKAVKRKTYATDHCPNMSAANGSVTSLLRHHHCHTIPGAMMALGWEQGVKPFNETFFVFAFLVNEKTGQF